MQKQVNDLDTKLAFVHDQLMRINQLYDKRDKVKAEMQKMIEEIESEVDDISDETYETCTQLFDFYDVRGLDAPVVVSSMLQYC